MSNMSYCRFRNTLPDLRDCMDAIAEGTDLSAKEHKAMQALVAVCRNIVDLADNGCLPEVEESDDE